MTVRGVFYALTVRGVVEKTTAARDDRAVPSLAPVVSRSPGANIHLQSGESESGK
jgi:hypothetical protein